MNKKVIIGVVIVIAAVLFGFYEAGQLRSYSDYSVMSSVERTYSAGSGYTEFLGNILIYGSDGITCMDLDDNLLWSQSYEVEEPLYDQCEPYVAIAEEDGTRVFVFNEDGYVNQFDINHHILNISVAANGSVAVIAEGTGSYLIDIYDVNGELDAEGEIYIENNGYPLALDLSDDADLLAVSFLTVSSGSAQTTINFYNFGSAGQGYENNIVSTYSYDNLTVPKITFLTQNRIAAVGDDTIIIYEGAEKPKETKSIEIEREITSVFSGNEKLGLVFRNNMENEASADADTAYTMVVYNASGKRQFETGFDLSYKSIDVLDNGEICILGDKACEIITGKGKTKFRYTFDEEIYDVISLGNLHNYAFVLSDHTDKVRLK